MSDIDMPYRPVDWANSDLAESVLNQRPVSAQPIDIPLGNLKPNPSGQPPRLSSLERSVALQEQAARDEAFKAQRAQELARQEEVFKREQAQRDALRNRTPTAEPPEPRITNRSPEWEQPTPTTKTPTQPGTPNSAKPPATPNGSGARVSPNLSPTATPSPGLLLEELPPPIAQPPTKPPSGLPAPVGQLARGSAIGAGIDLGFRLLAGQPPLQAGFGAAGNFAGSLGGAVLGSAFGPAGAFVGGLIGGHIGGRIADYIYSLAFPRPATPPEPGYFKWQTIKGSRYLVTFQWWFDATPNNKNSTSDLYWGPIGETIKSGPYTQGNGTEITTANNVVFPCYGLGLSPMQSALGYYNVVGSGSPVSGVITNIVYHSTVTVSNESNSIPAGSDTRTPNSYFHPGNQSYAPPTGNPAAGSKPAPNNYAPGGTSPGGSPRGDSFGWIPHAFPAPKANPNPNTTPSNLGGEFPGSTATPSPNPIGNPASDPLGSNQGLPKASADIGTSPKPGNFGDSNAQPIPLGSGGTSTVSGPASSPPSGLPNTGKKEPVSDGTSPTPKDQNPSLPIPLIPPLFLPANPASRAPTKEEIKEGVCELTSPDACLGSPLNNIQNTSNQNSNKLDQLNALLNGLDLAGLAALNSKLDLMNNKLGEQLPGGLSGKLTRFSKWLQIDRALNLLTLAASLHNAMMLSNELGQTLLGAINNILQLIGLKDDDGSTFDLGEVISSGVENLIKGVIGADNYVALTTAFAKANRIYQSSVNVLNSFQSFTSTVLNALEITAGRVGKIGNALRKSGEVLETAYGWMNPQPKFNRVTQFLENLQNGASTIQMVTQAPLDVINATTEMTNASTEFINAIKDDGTPANIATPEPEPDILKAAEAAIKTASAGQDMTDPDLEADE